VSIQFGSGTLEGEMNKDTVYFGGLEIPEQTLNEIRVEDNGVLEDASF